ncbi:nitroreductase family deazaflavin-dependent oxidoreductase [Streptomyces sp. ID03-2B]|uniref:nitroreductase family deazaflavin-dependent oxidoreductase n=1 Tax=unclassified Streptomyces TaxID=2593676 RepID=UPI0020BE4530|nr:MULTISPECIES: nitroreductase family deazaflavin-dependent oxidoreductase [unclassified Streptomyces]MCL6291643.1 nitroreductase family deazaflavin-dependent oxidoreductase [Streptomyces sp. 43Y-GA-1]MDX3594246.1 nitroreductase family deazaflavin-dependent oxidoreductase [Streptomyces sp. ID03-2B]
MTGARGARLVQKVSSTRAFGRIAPYVVPVLDRSVHRLTRGRVLLSARMLPGLVLTVPGARTGRPRTTPLACMPEGEAESGWILVGSNFGRTGHPAWTANLLARGGEAVVNWRGRDIPVRATLLEGEERARVWEAALKFWPPYAAYQRRVERQIRLFRLERR